VTGSGRHLFSGGILTFAWAAKKHNEEHQSLHPVSLTRFQTVKCQIQVISNSGMLLSKISTVYMEGGQLETEIRRSAFSETLHFRT